MKNNFNGAMLMILHALSVSILLALVKILSKDISSNQVVFFYKFFLLLMILPWLFKDGLTYFYTTRIKTYITGGILGTSATLCFMYSLKYIPLANAISLSYMEKVLLVLIGILYFKNKVTKPKIIAIIFTFIGALIVIFPRINLQDFNKYYYFIFASIILWVAYCLTVKSLGKTENIKTQTFYTVLCSSLLSFPVAFIDWQSGSFIEFVGIELKHLPLFFLTALCYVILTISAFKAFQIGDLAIVSPFGYTKIIFSGLLGVVLFAEYPSAYNYIGYAVITFSSWYLASSSSKKKQL